MLRDMEEIPSRHDIMASTIAMETQRSGGLKRPRDDQMGPGAKERRTRTIFNLAQINALERIFTDVEYPDGDLKAKLAHRLEVDENTVQIWFQNRRAKKKRLQRGQPLPNNAEPFHQHQFISHPGHLLPISDRQNYLPVSSDGGVYFPPAPSENHCYSTSSMMMGHPDPVMHWEGKTHFNPMEHYGMDQPRIPNLQTHSSPIALTNENSSAIDLIKSPPIITPVSTPVPSPARSVQSPTVSEGGSVVDQIRKWPVKEPPTSLSAFGKLDFPKLPRVCIRHDSAQMRNILNGVLGAGSPGSKGGQRDIAKMRMNVLKKDAPRSPPPNQTCAAIPRSQRNELEMALMKHGLAEDATSENGPNQSSSGHLADYRSDDLSSSSEESSDSEGLAPPRRRRKVVRDRQKPPPNTSCSSVPLHDRTLPYLSKIPQYSSEKVPIGQSAATLPQTPISKLPHSFELSLGDENISDWDTDSDDSSWAYFDQAPTKATAKESPQALLELPAGQCGPQSAPPALVQVEDINSLTTENENVFSGNVADCTEDEFSEITLAREFAEMLPSPLGSYLPLYHEDPSSSNQSCEPYRRPRIQSDSALISTRTDNRTHPHVDITLRNSPASTQSSESSLSGLSSLFNMPVSPSELVKHFADDVAGTDQSTPYEIQTSSHIPESGRQHPEGLIGDSGQQGILRNCQPPLLEDSHHGAYVQQHHTRTAFMNESMGCHEANSFLTSDTQKMDIRHVQKPNVRSDASVQGIIRPIPTRPLQATSSSLSQTNVYAPASSGHVGDTMAFPDCSGFPVATLHQNVTYGQNQIQGDPNLIYSSPSFHKTIQTNGFHPRVDVHPHTVVHHQPTSDVASQHAPRWPTDPQGAGIPRHPSSAAPRNVSLPMSAPNDHGAGLPRLPSSAAPRNVSLPMSAPNDHGAGLPRLPSSAPPRNVSLPMSAPNQTIVPSEDNLPPNQVCTVVPDAVSSQGLMARYLAWTQGRTLER